MAKTIAIFQDIYSWTAEEFVKAINDAERFNEDIEVHISTNGGEVEQTFAMLIRLQNFKGNKSIVVDGKAYSMGAFFCLYSDTVEAYDVSQFMLHRAAFPKWYEESELFTEEVAKRLNTINGILKRRMKLKLDEKAFEEVAGMTIDELFEGEQKDVFFTAQEAKKIGLISKIRTLDAVAKMEINAICEDLKITAMYKDKDVSESPKGQANSQSINKINKKMTIDDVKKNHPEVVKALQDEFKAEVEDTISAWAEFKDVNATSVIEGITSLKAPTAKDFAKFQKEMAKSNIDLGKLEEESPEATGSDVPAVGGSTETPAPEAKSGKDLMAEYLKGKGL